MNTNFEKEMKLLNLMKLLEIYGDEKWGVKKQISDKDKSFIREKALEHIESNFLNETLRNSFRLKLFRIDNKENWIRFDMEEKELLRQEILNTVFDQRINEETDSFAKEVAIGNMIEVLSIQSKNRFMELSEEQTDYLNNMVSQYKEELDNCNKNLNLEVLKRQTSITR